MEQKNQVFTGYETFVIAIISLLQFTIILDFMVMAPLGAQLIRILKISPAQFGWAGSAYAFSAGIAGILAAGFAEQVRPEEDAVVLLCRVHSGDFALRRGAGLPLPAAGPDGDWLCLAGCLFSINMAIVADLFPLERGGG